jgi:hypothetical protein
MKIQGFSTIEEAFDRLCTSEYRTKLIHRSAMYLYRYDKAFTARHLQPVEFTGEWFGAFFTHHTADGARPHICWNKWAVWGREGYAPAWEAQCAPQLERALYPHEQSLFTVLARRKLEEQPSPAVARHIKHVQQSTLHVMQWRGQAIVED